MEIHINLEFIESIDELKATIDELKDMEYLGTKIFVNVEKLKIGSPKIGKDEEEKIKDPLKTIGVEWEQIKHDSGYLAFCLATANFLKSLNNNTL